MPRPRQPRPTQKTRADGHDACGCASPSRTATVGAGGAALDVDPELKQANLRHLRRIEGQIRGIAAMVEQDRYCADIITQVSAVRESLHAVARNLLRNHLRHCAAAAMRADTDSSDAMVEEVLDLTAKLSR